MKVGLSNTYSYNNIGDAAIYSALAKLLIGHQLYSVLQQHSGQSTNNIQYANSLNHCDRFISVGGDIFNNARPWFLTRNFLSNLKQLNTAPQSTSLFGQSIPASCSGLSLKLLARQLKKLAAVTVRDQHSYRQLTELGVNCSLSYDTAFTLQCSEQAVSYAAELLASMQIHHCVVISVREFNHLYDSNNQRFCRTISKLCHQLIKHHYQPLLVIQSHVSELDTDWHIAKAIKQQCSGIKILDLVNHQSQFENWEMLQAILKIAQIIVAVRYHTAVLALAAGRVPFNLYYSSKGADLSQRLAIPGCHVDLFQPEQLFNLIEKTGTKHFDSQVIREQVKNDFLTAFNHCLPEVAIKDLNYENI